MTREISDADRITQIERDLRDHSKILTAYGETIKLLDQERINRMIVDAREDERDLALNQRLDRMEASIIAVKKPLWSVADTIGLAILGAVMTFILKGGLAQ